MNPEREFSKKYAQSERDKLAQEIRNKRKLNADDFDDERVQETKKELRRNFIGKIFKTEEFLRDREILERLTGKLKKQEILKLQKDFERKLTEIAKNTPLSQEEQEKYLSEEALINMNLEDYLFLLNRLSGYYVSHVTRYGVRENTLSGCGAGHTLGVGTFLDSFTSLLESKKINSFFSQIIDKTEHGKNSVKTLIDNFKKPGMEKSETIEKILALPIFADCFPFSGRRGDRSSAHVAGNDILEMYGTEKNYDIYFYFPAEFIAKNYIHDCRLDFSDRGSQRSRNDVSVWNEGGGIPIDAGICCIPGNLEVDAITGSQYKLDQGGRPSYSLKPEKIVSSKDYWENYFKQNSERRPSKVFYYPAGNRFRSIGFNKDKAGEVLQELEQSTKKEIDSAPQYETYIDSTKEQLRKAIEEIYDEVEKTE